jgi:hypothetical protein
MQTNHLSWVKSFGSSGGYYDKINDLISQTKLTSESSTNIIKHAVSLPANTPVNAGNLYMFKDSNYE